MSVTEESGCRQTVSSEEAKWMRLKWPTLVRRGGDVDNDDARADYYWESRQHSLG